MKWRARVWPIIAFWGLATSPFTAHASQVLVGNLDQPVSSFSPSIIDPADTWAQEFTTGTSANLQSIIASLGNINLGNNGDFTLTAQLFSVTSAITPPDPTMGATLLDTLTLNGGMASIPTSGFGNVEFDPSVTIGLVSTQYYWFVLSGSSSDGSGSVQWQFTDSTSHSGPGTLPNYGFLPTAPPWLVLGGSPFLIQVNGASIPEPSSMILGCIGISTVLFAGRWSRSRRGS